MGEINCIVAKNFLFRYTIGVKQSDIVHLECHNHYEIYFYKAGGVQYSVEGQKHSLTPNALLFIAPQAFHGYTVKNSNLYERHVISFKKDFLSDQALHYCNLLFDLSAAPYRHHCFMNTENYYINNYFYNIINCQYMERNLQSKALLANLECLIFQIYHMYKASASTPYLLGAPTFTPDKVVDIIAYLNENIRDTITLDSISTKFYISKHHLNKLFKAATGTTVIKYVLFKKITIAQNLIQNNIPITEASIFVGFSDYSNFYRNYLNIIGYAPTLDVPKS